MSAESIDKAQINKGIRILQASDRDGSSQFPLDSVSYYPSNESAIHGDLRFQYLVREFGPNFSARPINSLSAEGKVKILPVNSEGLYTAQLYLQDIFETQWDRLGEIRELRLRNIPVPKAALAPDLQIIEGHSNILIPGSKVYTLYTKDAEGSRWSIHISRAKLDHSSAHKSGIFDRVRRFLS